MIGHTADSKTLPSTEATEDPIARFRTESKACAHAMIGYTGELHTLSSREATEAPATRICTDTEACAQISAREALDPNLRYKTEMWNVKILQHELNT